MSSLPKYTLAVSAASAIAAQLGYGYMWMVSANTLNRVSREVIAEIAPGITEPTNATARPGYKQLKLGKSGEIIAEIAPGITESTNATARPGYREGPHAIISDSLFSLVIFIYVAIVFCYMFYAFCWKEPPRPASDTDSKNIPMITSMLEEMEKEVSQEKLERESLEKKEKLEANGNGKNDDETTPL